MYAERLICGQQLDSQLLLRIVNITDDPYVVRCIRRSRFMPSGLAALPALILESPSKFTGAEDL